MDVDGRRLAASLRCSQRYQLCSATSIEIEREGGEGGDDFESNPKIQKGAAAVTGTRPRLHFFLFFLFLKRRKNKLQNEYFVATSPLRKKKTSHGAAVEPEAVALKVGIEKEGKERVWVLGKDTIE